jgi:hypothetical protein
VPKGCKRLRYDGVQATKTFAPVQVLLHEALAQVAGVVKGAIKRMARLTYRQRYEQSTGRDPWRCPHCQGEMGGGASGTQLMGASTTTGDQPRHVCLNRATSWSLMWRS